jgi:hypothetical protein
MISEGVDIPRLRVGVYATNTVTDLFFRQAVGRLVRWVSHLGRQAAYMFIPDDQRLRAFGATIAEQRRHSLRRVERDDAPARDGDQPPREKAEPEAAEDGQLSLFTAISAVPLDAEGRRLGEAPRLFDEDAGGGDGDGERIPDLAGSEEAEGGDGGPFAQVPLAPVPLPAPEQRLEPAAQSPLARRRALREQNSEAVADLARLSGKSHADLNGDLNRRAGIRRISEASIKQLQQRLELARKMLRR